MNQPFCIVAIDGGAATGKSTTARGISKALNFMHVDTGSHYRAITYALLEAGAAEQPEPEATVDFSALQLGTAIEARAARIQVNQHTLSSEQLRSDRVNANVSFFSACPPIRAYLKSFQRNQAEIAREAGFPGMVMEGRDIGSVIFPDAHFRFFLEADSEARAERRAKEGQTDAIAERDRRDASRKTAPLTCPPGAIKIDTHRLGISEVLALCTRIILGEETSQPSYPID